MVAWPTVKEKADHNYLIVVVVQEGAQGVHFRGTTTCSPSVLFVALL